MNEEKCNVLAKEQKNNNSGKELSLKDINAFVKARFTEVKKSNKIKELVSFQATNKFFIMVRSQEELKILGRIVASNNKSNLPEILSEYEKHLNIVLMLCPTVKTHSNVLMHIFGFFSNE
ncbi:MAG: YbgA family protein, partial [Nitrosopumilus sp.]|nr:YbgA family protein [Nitrosopumilus sp.]